MLRCNLRFWMAELQLNSVSDVMKITGLSRKTIAKLRDEEELETVELGTLLTVCQSFNRSLRELIEYNPIEHVG